MLFRGECEVLLRCWWWLCCCWWWCCLTLVFCVDSTLCECGWAVTLPTGIACLPHTHNSVRMMMKVMRMVRMVLILGWWITIGDYYLEDVDDADYYPVEGLPMGLWDLPEKRRVMMTVLMLAATMMTRKKKLWLTLRLRVEFAYEPDLPEKLKFQQTCPTLLQHHHANNYCNSYHHHAYNCNNDNVNYDNIMVMIIMINTMIIMEL